MIPEAKNSWYKFVTNFSDIIHESRTCFNPDSDFSTSMVIAKLHLIGKPAQLLAKINRANLCQTNLKKSV